MSTDLMNISAFKGVAPAAAFKAALDPNAESLADGIGSSYGIIGYKGKVWSLRLRGETYTVIRPDDGSPAAFLDVIILRQLPNKSKSYYPSNTYVDGAIGTRPVCAALDGVAPDADIATPQSPACATCEKNVFKINTEGRKTRECSDYKRLAVLILPSITKQLLGAPLMEPVFLRVPAASLNDLALLGEGMSAQGFHYSTYVTRIGFNPEKPHPQMTFRALQALTDREAPVVLPLREDPAALRITGESEVGKSRTAIVNQSPAKVQQTTNVVQLAQNQTPNPAQAPTAVVAPQAPEPSAIDTGFGGDAVVTAAVTGMAAQPDTEGGIFGDTATAQVNVAPASNTAADVGMTEDADDDLDARVQALLKQ